MQQAYQHHAELLRRIKKSSWNARTAWQLSNPNTKSISTYAMYNACVKPFDAEAAATSAASNKSHEHFGKPVEEIKSIWKAKGESGASRGNSIDDYVNAVIKNEPFDFSETDEVFKNKAIGVDKFFKDINGRFGSFVGDETWLFDQQNGINVRCDSIFFNESMQTIFVCEWKNITSFKTHNVKNQCHGPLTGFDNCDLVKVNMQVYTYKNILEQYFGAQYKIVPMIINFVENDYSMIPTLLDTRYKKLIYDVSTYAHSIVNNVSAK